MPKKTQRRLAAQPHSHKTTLPSAEQLYPLAEIFKLLGEPARLKLLLACQSGQQNVGMLAARAELSQPLASHHLRLLKAARLLRSSRDGQQIFYHLHDQHVADMLSGMLAHITEEGA